MLRLVRRLSSVHVALLWLAGSIVFAGCAFFLRREGERSQVAMLREAQATPAGPRVSNPRLDTALAALQRLTDSDSVWTALAMAVDGAKPGMERDSLAAILRSTPLALTPTQWEQARVLLGQVGMEVTGQIVASLQRTPLIPTSVLIAIGVMFGVPLLLIVLTGLWFLGHLRYPISSAA